MTICIKNLRLRTILGVHEEERTAEREIIVNLQMEYDARAAARTDSLDSAFNYKDIRDRIVTALSGTRFNLLEALADHILNALIQDPRIEKLRIEIDKPNALRSAESVSAIISWSRGSG